MDRWFSRAVIVTLALLAVLAGTAPLLAAMPGAGLLPGGPPPSPAGPVRDANTEVELLAEHETVRPGEPIHLGLRMQMDEHWHSYWHNPGASGMATTIRWDLPEGFEAQPIAWPHPDRFELGGLVSYGYEDEILLLVRIDAPADVDAQRVTLEAEADWLTCKEICLPGEATLRLELPVSDAEPSVNRETQELFAAARDRLPRELDDERGQRVSVHRENESLVLRAAGLLDADAELVDAYFYATQGRKLDYNAAQSVTREGDGLTLALTPSPLRTAGDGAIDRLEGVLVIVTESRSRAYNVAADVAAAGRGAELR